MLVVVLALWRSSASVGIGAGCLCPVVIVGIIAFHSFPILPTISFAVFFSYFFFSFFRGAACHKSISLDGGSQT